MNNKIMEYEVALVGRDGDAIRWITIKGMDRDDVIARLDAEYMADDAVIGYWFAEDLV